MKPNADANAKTASHAKIKMDTTSLRHQRLARLAPVELLQTLKSQVVLAIEMLQTNEFAKVPPNTYPLDNLSLGYVGDFEIRVRPD
jgi:hypothetical protein